MKLSYIDDLTEGTACTVLQARKFIDNDKPLIIGNSDQIVDLDLAKYLKDCLERDLDGSILVFKDLYYLKNGHMQRRLVRICDRSG